MNKKEFLSQLENAKNNFILVLASVSLFSNDKSLGELGKSNCSFGTYSLSFKQVENMMRNLKSKEIACNEFLKMGVRALIKESFELIKDYLKNTNQLDKFTKQDWYQFARILRNCLSHECKFRFNDYDKSLLPVGWKNKIINLDLDDTFLQLSFFGYVDAWELFNEMNLFVKDFLE
ncbi:MAG: hypothetical protein ACTSWK_16855 [Promethearchaeota archaeon]